MRRHSGLRSRRAALGQAREREWQAAILRDMFGYFKVWLHIIYLAAEEAGLSRGSLLQMVAQATIRPSLRDRVPRRVRKLILESPWGPKAGRDPISVLFHRNARRILC